MTEQLVGVGHIYQLVQYCGVRGGPLAGRGGRGGLVTLLSEQRGGTGYSGPPQSNLFSLSRSRRTVGGGPAASHRIVQFIGHLTRSSVT